MENSTTKPIIIAGLCVIERDDVVFSTAERIAAVGNNLGVDIIFKASFDKANRTSIHSYRGVGIERGLELLGEVKRRYGMRITTDIHEAWQAERVASVADIIQIPAFLCRQTDLIVAAAHSGCIVNIKKAQFLSGRDMRHPYLKAIESGAREVWLTERGNMYGYNDLVVCPTSMQCAYNVTTAPKELFVVPQSRHYTYPEQRKLRSEWLLDKLLK